MKRHLRFVSAQPVLYKSTTLVYIVNHDMVGRVHLDAIITAHALLPASSCALGPCSRPPDAGIALDGGVDVLVLDLERECRHECWMFW